MTHPAVLSPFLRPEIAGEAVQRGLAVTCRPVTSIEEVALHYEIRRRVFVLEQGVFPFSDRDVHDGAPGTVCVLGLCGAVAGGAVRLYPLAPDAAGGEEGIWKGDRLAVLPPFRAGAVKGGMGGQLVRFAVRAAGERGGRRMVAHIQPANVIFFEHLGWRTVGGLVDYAGLPHQQMAIDLSPG
ncbi:MAG TPA: MSMEG_0567/Sll0786 family nitrogen starvation N-acetyltransferase [Actinomycetota bacterium]|nr:MSMEG_0567/Sll0786 family nitrogen starvation N-acetyltransferase [Actinomycetota bacterium]